MKKGCTYQPPGAVSAGVNLLASKSHGQQSQQPRDQGSSRGSGQSLSAPQRRVVTTSQACGHSHHARNQGNDKECAGDSVACCNQNTKTINIITKSPSILHQFSINQLRKINLIRSTSNHNKTSTSSIIETPSLNSSSSPKNLDQHKRSYRD